MNYSQNYYDYITYVQGLHRQKLSNSHIDYVYYESHHILPKCAGGNASKTNIVLLTAREHFLAHYLLVKIYQNTPLRYKMSYALSCLSKGFTTQNRGYINSHLFASLRQNLGEMLSYETKIKIGAANRRHFENPEYRAKISAIHSGKKPTEEIRQLLSKRAFERSTPEYREKIRQIRLGAKASKESKKKCSESMKKVWASRKAIKEKI